MILFLLCRCQLEALTEPTALFAFPGVVLPRPLVCVGGVGGIQLARQYLECLWLCVQVTKISVL